ncbi:MAG: dienelactone hydrolase family protein [Gammaproteobacteria bacterium]|nr:dienelactone hydrolase family protein [Gammaproteobacteria bacterium]
MKRLPQATDADPAFRLPDVCESGGVTLTGPDLAGFAQFSFAANGYAHVVYHTGQVRDPALLLLPELAGFAPGLRAFAERLAAAGYNVFIPWLYGPIGRRTPLRNAVKLCIVREFGRLRSGRTSPVTVWLRALAAHLCRHLDGGRIGAIGMCLSGAFVIPLIIDPAVAAAVAAQPSVPLSWLFLACGVGSSRGLGRLNVSDEEIRAARARLDRGEARLLAVRCRADRICPNEKIQRLIREFPEGLEVREYGSDGDRNALGQRPHATFTKEYRLAPDAASDHYSRQAFADLIEFLDRHLRAGTQKRGV